MSMKTRYDFEDDQIATLNAALRFYQREGMGDPSNRSNEIHQLATADDTQISLDDGGIDELCMILNLDGQKV